jgi:hypothetical protein
MLSRPQRRPSCSRRMGGWRGKVGSGGGGRRRAAAAGHRQPPMAASYKDIFLPSRASHCVGAICAGGGRSRDSTVHTLPRRRGLWSQPRPGAPLDAECLQHPQRRHPGKGGRACRQPGTPTAVACTRRCVPAATPDCCSAPPDCYVYMFAPQMWKHFRCGCLSAVPACKRDARCPAGPLAAPQPGSTSLSPPPRALRRSPTAPWGVPALLASKLPLGGMAQQFQSSVRVRAWRAL